MECKTIAEKSLQKQRNPHRVTVFISTLWYVDQYVIQRHTKANIAPTITKV